MEKRIINGAEPAMPVTLNSQELSPFKKYPGTPIQLHLAAQLMAAHVTGCVRSGFPYDSYTVAGEALKDAKALIDLYNVQYSEEANS